MSFLKKLLSAIFPSKPAVVVTTSQQAPARSLLNQQAPAVEEVAPVEDVVEAPVVKKPRAKKAPATTPKAPRKPKMTIVK